MRRLFFPPALEQVRKHVLTGDFAAQNDHDQNQADRQIKVLRAHAEAERQTVTENADDQRREHRADDAALAARVQRAAEHDSCDDGQRIAGAEVIFGGVDVRGQQRARNRGTHSRKDVRAHDRSTGVDAGIFRRLRIHADQEQALAILGAVENPHAQQNQHNVDHNLRRNAEDIAFAEETEADELARLVLRRETADTLIRRGRGHAGNHQRNAGIQEAAAQRNNHRLHAAVCDEETGERAAQRGDHHGDRHSRPDVQPGVAPEHADDDTAQTDDRRRLNVNAAGNHDHRHKQRDDADADVVDDAVHDGLRTQELRVGRAKHHKFQNQEDHQKHFPVLENLFQHVLHAFAPPS